MPTHSVLPEDEVRRRVRQRLESRRLPLLRPDHISAGYGSANMCCACDQLIDRTKIEYEVAAADKAQRLTFHFACYVIWQRMCSERMDERSQQGLESQERTPSGSGPSRASSAPAG